MSTADLSGSGRYGGNTLIGDGIVLEALLPDGKVESCASNDGVDPAQASNSHGPPRLDQQCYRLYDWLVG